MSSTVEPALTPPAVAEQLLDALVARGHRHYTGVPCSLLKGLFSALENETEPNGAGRVSYVPAPREDTAVGVATGLALTDARPVAMMQNSGLGYCLNVLTSLNLIYDIHPLLVVSWRGADPGDAVEHDVIGRELDGLLDLFGFCWSVLDHDDVEGSLARTLDRAAAQRRLPVLVVREGI